MAKFLETFKEYPPRQKPGSFSVDRMVERRAIEAAVWGMPIVNFQAMRDGLKKDAGVGFNDVAYNSKVQTWR